MEGGIAPTSSPTTHHLTPNSLPLVISFTKESRPWVLWLLVPIAGSLQNSWQMEGGESWVGIRTSGSQTRLCSRESGEP